MYVYLYICITYGNYFYLFVFVVSCGQMCVYICIYMCKNVHVCVWLSIFPYVCVCDCKFVVAALIFGELLGTVRLLGGFTLLKFRALWTFTCVVVVIFFFHSIALQ